MAVSMLTSLWMQNAAVVAMLCPVCLAVLEELEAVSYFRYLMGTF